MATVPYNPVPSVEPSSQGTPKFSVTTPGAAFGENIAQAVEGLGGVLQHSGDELFTRALAMQQLRNEADAKDADAQYMISAGQKHAEFSSLQGKAAVDAYPQYAQDLQDSRQAFRSSLGNDQARKMFDSQSLSTMGRTIFNGAGHAAIENKKYALGASHARTDALGDQALLQPKDEDNFQQSLSATRDEVAQQGDLQGWGQDQTDQATDAAVSNLWTKRIQGLAKSAPYQAQKMLDDATAKGQIRGENLAKITNYVNQQMYTTGSRNISHDISTGADNPGRNVVDLPSAKAAIGEYESGNNYASLGKEVFSADGTSRGRALGKYQVMPENLQPWLKQAGLPAMSEQEFLKSPQAQDQVFATVFGGYMKQYGSFNDAASMWFSGKTMAESGGRKDGNNTTVPTYLANTNAILARNMPLADKVSRGQEIATQQSPNDPLLGDYVRDRIITDHNRANAVKHDDDYRNRQAVENVLVTGDQQGKFPTTVEELKAASPEAEAAWDAMQPSEQRKYAGILAKNAKGDTAWNEDRLQSYQKLKGMAQADPAEFLNQDVVSADMPFSARKELVNLQGRLSAKADGDPRVTRAIGILKPDLQAAGITTKNKDEYYQFVGSLQDALETYQQDNKKSPPADEVRKMGARLLQQVPGTGYFGSNVGTSQMYSLPVPDDAAKIIKEDPKWTEMGVTPTDEQVRRIYSRAQYQKLYGGSVAVKPAAGPKPPQAPRE